MKFSEKYRQLNDPEMLEEVVVSTIKSTMLLEEQPVSDNFLKATVKKILQKRKRRKLKKL
ncbi:MAG: hypothetical protein JXQ87_04855 [Bacteroidia bacterium]